MRCVCPPTNQSTGGVIPGVDSQTVTASLEDLEVIGLTRTAMAAATWSK